MLLLSAVVVDVEDVVIAAEDDIVDDDVSDEDVDVDGKVHVVLDECKAQVVDPRCCL